MPGDESVVWHDTGAEVVLSDSALYVLSTTLCDIVALLVAASVIAALLVLVSVMYSILVHAAAGNVPVSLSVCHLNSNR